MQTQKNAKRILIYGDSYTFGKIPGGARYDSETRFTGITQKHLGEEYEIIEEGLRGRMAVGENAFFPHRDGLAQFDGILGSHLPLNLIILFLGTNDMNSGSQKSPEQVVASFQMYLDKIAWWCQHFSLPMPKIAILAPPLVNEQVSIKAFGDIFKGAGPKSQALHDLLKQFATDHDLDFLDASELIQVSEVDGVHLDEKSNQVLGEKLAQFITSVIG